MDDPPLHTECMVSRTLGFILRLSRVLCLAPLQFQAVENAWRIRVTPFYNKIGLACGMSLLLLSTTGIIIVCVLKLVIHDDYTSKKKSAIRILVWFLGQFIIYIVVLVALLTSSNRLRLFINTMAQLKQINEEFNRYSRQSLPTGLKNTTINAIIFILMILICGVFLIDVLIGLIEMNNYYAIMTISVLYLSYTLACIQQLVLVVQFSLMTSSVLSSLKQLNTILKVLKDDVDNALPPTLLDLKLAWAHKIQQNTFNENRKISNLHQINIPIVNEHVNRSESIHNLALRYCSLCTLIRQLDKSHGLVLVLLISALLLHLTMPPYYIITNTYGYRMWIQLIRLVYNFMKLLMILEPCHATHQELIISKRLVNSLLRHSSPYDAKFHSELKLFNCYIFLNDVGYSPMQLFTLDRSLITAIIGSAVTYLVIAVKL